MLIIPQVLESERFVTLHDGRGGHVHRLEPLSTKKSTYQRLLAIPNRRGASPRLVPVVLRSDEASNYPGKTLRELFGQQCKVVGKGAFGTVTAYRKLAPSRDAIVAVKVFHSRCNQAFATPELRTALYEFRMAGVLDHVNILRIIGVFHAEDAQTYYQAMEYCDAGDVLSLMQSSTGRGGLDPNEANCFFKQLVCGVQYLHSAGIAHCDLKPENILLTSSGVVKICDFGCSKYTSRPSLDQSTTTITATAISQEGYIQQSEHKQLLVGARGSLPYIAPEEHTEAGYDGQAADIWACGVIFVILRTGFYLWQSATEQDDEYSRYREERRTEKGYGPIESLKPVQCRNIVYTLLDPKPDRRLTAEQFMKTDWGRAIETCISGTET